MPPSSQNGHSRHRFTLKYRKYVRRDSASRIGRISRAFAESVVAASTQQNSIGPFISAVRHTGADATADGDGDVAPDPDSAPQKISEAANTRIPAFTVEAQSVSIPHGYIDGTLGRNDFHTTARS